MPQSLSDPGAAAASALFDFLADHEANQRQAMLDEITKSTAARQDEVARANLELQREQMAGLREQREAAADLNRQKKALGVVGTLMPDAAIDAETADIIRQGGLALSSTRHKARCSERRRLDLPMTRGRGWSRPAPSALRARRSSRH